MQTPSDDTNTGTLIPWKVEKLPDQTEINFIFGKGELSADNCIKLFDQ